MKQLKRILVILAIVIVGLFLGKNLIATSALSGGVKLITGLDTQVGSMHVGLLNTAVGIKGLRVLNPHGFPERVMVEVPEIFVDYDLGSFLKGEAHLQTMRVNLAELHVIKSAEGQLNLNSVKALESGKTGAGKQPQAGPMPKFLIDVLELKVGKVVYKDYTANPPMVKEFAVNIDERYKHITNPYTFGALVFSRALMKTTVGQLANFDVKGLQATVSEGLKQSAAQLTSTLTEGTDAAQRIGQEALGTASEAVKSTTGTLKKLLGN